MTAAYGQGMQPNVAPQVRGIDLKAERVRTGLTQRELGERLGVSPRRIANVEAEYRPAAGIVRRILAALMADGLAR